MAVVVENGTGMSNANSYLSRDNANTYHADRLNDLWTDSDDAVKDAALIKATQFLDAEYGGKFKGSKKVATQALMWPRVEATDRAGDDVASDSVPQQIKDATAELALRAITTGNLSPDEKRGGRIKSQTLGELSVTYEDGAPSGTAFKFVDQILRSLIGGSGGAVVKVARA